MFQSAQTSLLRASGPNPNPNPDPDPNPDPHQAVEDAESKLKLEQELAAAQQQVEALGSIRGRADAAKRVQRAEATSSAAEKQVASLKATLLRVQGERNRAVKAAEQVEQVSRRGRVAARPRPHLPRQAAPHRQRVQSARLRSAAARYLSLLGLDLQRPGCAAHSARAAEPRRAQREGAALRPGPSLQFCDFWLPGADSESEGSDADEGET